MTASQRGKGVVGSPLIKVTDTFRAVWMSGAKTTDIARVLNVSQSTVSRTARLAGLPKRRTGPIAANESRFVSEASQ